MTSRGPPGRRSSSVSRQHQWSPESQLRLQVCYLFWHLCLFLCSIWLIKWFMFYLYRCICQCDCLYLCCAELWFILNQWFNAVVDLVWTNECVCTLKKCMLLTKAIDLYNFVPSCKEDMFCWNNLYFLLSYHLA